MPTRPVPAPSSRTAEVSTTSPDSCSHGSRLASVYALPHVLCPSESPVSVGSWRVMLTSAVILKVRDCGGAQARPQREERIEEARLCRVSVSSGVRLVGGEVMRRRSHLEKFGGGVGGGKAAGSQLERRGVK